MEQSSEILQSQVTAEECADLRLGGRHGPPEITEKIGATRDLLRIIGNCCLVLSIQPSCLGFLSLKSFVITKCEVNCLCVLVRFIF